MPNPQTENGFIQIATGNQQNDILMALVKQRLNGTQYQVVLLVIRKTWGFKKKDDWISLTQFQNYLSKSRENICREIKQLVNKNILVKKSTPGVSAFYSINKDFDTWKQLVNKKSLVKELASKSTSEEKSTSEQNVNQLVNKKSPTKETITKENILMEKKVKKPTKEDLEKEQFLKMTEELIGFYNSTYGTNYTAPPLLNNVKYWLGMYSCGQIKAAIFHIKYDSYWKDIMTPIIFFRRRNQRGEEVDNIGKFLNTAKPPEVSTMPPPPAGFYK